MQFEHYISEMNKYQIKGNETNLEGEFKPSWVAADQAECSFY